MEKIISRVMAARLQPAALTGCPTVSRGYLSCHEIGVENLSVTHRSFLFLPRDAMHSASYAMAQCLSVSPSRLCIVLKLLNISQTFLPSFSPPFSFLRTKYYGKILTGSL